MQPMHRNPNQRIPVLKVLLSISLQRKSLIVEVLLSLHGNRNTLDQALMM